MKYLFILLIFVVTDVSAIKKKINFRHARIATSWSNCGSASDPIQITRFQIIPDTVRLPGTFTVTADVNIASNLSAPIEMNLKLNRKTVLGWIKIPCLDNLGSCNYGDICGMSPYHENCPPIYQQFDLPCHCPVSQGIYIVDKIPIVVKGHIPHWLEKGHYKGRIQLSENGNQLGCYEIESKLN